MNSRHFLKFFFVSQVLAILGFIFILIVVVHKKDSAKTAISQEFLWHPVLMALSFGYLFGTSITVFRALRYIKKIHLKRLHAAIHLLAIAFAIGGLVPVFDMYYTFGMPHLRNLHTLFGIITVIFFCIQWVVSFLVFLYPQGPEPLRGMLMPYHVIVGFILFVTALLAVITGIDKYNGNTNGTLNMEGVLLNFAGFFYLINFILVAYMLLKKEFRRQPIDEDNQSEPDMK